MRIGIITAGFLFFMSCIATTVQSAEAEGEAVEIEVKNAHFPGYVKGPFYEMTLQKAYPIVFKEEPIVHIHAALNFYEDNTKEVAELEKVLNDFGWGKSIISKSSLGGLVKVGNKKNKVYILRIHQVARKVNGIFIPLEKGLMWSYSLRSFSTEGKVQSLGGGIASSILIIVEQLNQEVLNRTGENKAEAEKMASKPNKKQTVVNAVNDLIEKQVTK